MAKLTVNLLGAPGDPIQNEDDKAAEAITPGHLLTYDGSGDLIKHATAGGFTEPMFALEREEMGDDMNVAYAIGDTVKVGDFRPGCRVNAIVASGVTVSKGTYLESAGNGTLRAFAAGTKIARALEALTATSTSRLRVKIV